MLKNAYAVSLGIDRWAALVAAWHRTKHATVVVNAGTANQPLLDILLGQVSVRNEIAIFAVVACDLQRHCAQVRERQFSAGAEPCGGDQFGFRIDGLPGDAQGLDQGLGLIRQRELRRIALLDPDFGERSLRDRCEWNLLDLTTRRSRRRRLLRPSRLAQAQNGDIK